MPMNTETTAVHAGREDCTALGVHVPPLDQSSTYPLPSVEAGGAAYERMATGGRPTPGDSLVYQRLWNPNVDRCLLYTSPSPRDKRQSRMPSSA